MPVRWQRSLSVVIGRSHRALKTRKALAYLRPGDELVQHDAERVQVAPRLERYAE
jgi:hypothetical protein